MLRGKKINAREARSHFSELLDQVEHGAVIAILRRGHEIARIVPANETTGEKLTTLKAFRESIKVTGRSLSAEVIRSRREERF